MIKRQKTLVAVFARKSVEVQVVQFIPVSRVHESGNERGINQMDVDDDDVKQSLPFPRMGGAKTNIVVGMQKCEKDEGINGHSTSCLKSVK